MIKKLLAFCLLPLAGLLLVAPRPVDAASVNYQVYKYGTNTRSMASGYYVQPAKVQANGNQYLVTMTIHTKTSLGKWPVTVLSINGTGPANVTKTKSASGYDYRYAFETKDLGAVVNSQININVLHVYAAKQNVSFQFDTRQLPKLTAATTTKAQADKAATKATKQATKAMQAKTKQLAAQIRAVNKENQRTHQTILLGGGVSLAILAVAAYFYVKRR